MTLNRVSYSGPCLVLTEKLKNVEGSAPHLNKITVMMQWWKKEVHTQLCSKSCHGNETLLFTDLHSGTVSRGISACLESVSLLLVTSPWSLLGQHVVLWVRWQGCDPPLVITAFHLPCHNDRYGNNKCSKLIQWDSILGLEPKCWERETLIC